jgi:hypothetical protein
MIVNNFCICGHFESSHTKYRLTSGSYRGYCISCFSINPQKSLVHLHEFKPDNLKYLEQVAAEGKYYNR